jgi:hypothetical protein
MCREVRFLLYELLAGCRVMYCMALELFLLVARWKNVCRLVRVVENETMPNLLIFYFSCLGKIW